MKGSERLGALAQDIVRKGVDIVLADGRLAAQAMQAGSRTVPVVAVAGEPVLNGLAASLSRPGGNVTGVATMAMELGPKQLEFLHEILPSARRIGVIDGDNETRGGLSLLRGRCRLVARCIATHRDPNASRRGARALTCCPWRH